MRYDELLGDFGTAIREGNLAEYAVGKGFRECLAVSDIVGKKYYVREVGSCEARSPIKDVSERDLIKDCVVDVASTICSLSEGCV